MNYNYNDIKADIRKNFAYMAIVAFGAYLLFLLSDFIAPFLGALTFFVIFRPLIIYLTVKKKWNKNVAATIVIIISFFIVLIPVLSLSTLLYSKVIEVLQKPETIMSFVNLVDEKVMQLTGVELFNKENILSIQAKIADTIPSLLGETIYVLGNIGIMYFILYYMLINIETLHSWSQKYLPFTSENTHVLYNELNNMTLSNAVAVPLIGIIQGSAAGLGYWFFGLSEPFFWAVITAFVSLLPLIGTTLIWAPASLFLLATSSLFNGLGLMIYGVLVIINIDNISRFVIQKRFADVHPLVTVFGVILGLNLFGLPGLIFGPLMISYFILFIKIYRNIYHKESI